MQGFEVGNPGQVATAPGAAARYCAAPPQPISPSRPRGCRAAGWSAVPLQHCCSKGGPWCGSKARVFYARADDAGYLVGERGRRNMQPVPEVQGRLKRRTRCADVVCSQVDGARTITHTYSRRPAPWAQRVLQRIDVNGSRMAATLMTVCPLARPGPRNSPARWRSPSSS